MAINFLSSIDVAGTVSVSSVSNDNSSYTGILVWDGGLLKYRTKSQLLTDIGGDINNYVSSISFNTTNGILSLPRTGLSTLTVDLDGRYVDLTTNQTIAGIKTFSTRVKGNVGTPLDTFMMPQNPEGKHISAPWFFNDMAYARLKGATINVVVNGGSSPSTANIDAMFDASTGFWSMSTAGITSVVITMSSLPKTMYYGTYMGLTFGNINWIAKDITLESYYNGQWNTLETYTNQTEEFVIKSYNSSGNAQSQLRYTLSNFNTTSMRIVSLFAYNYNATGMPSLYATLNGFSMYGQVDMNQNKIIDLPTPTATTDAANKAYVDAHVSPRVIPGTPSSITSTIVGETIEIEFNQSATTDIDYYQVWSSDDGGDYGIIAQITPTDFSSTMTVVDTTFVTGGTMSYRVYAVKSGVYSSPGTTSIVYTVGTLDVTDMTVINLNTAYYIQYEKPASRFIDHIEIYMDSQTTQGALNRSNASIVYSGQNPSYMRSVGVSNNFHQFWVEVVTT